MTTAPVFNVMMGNMHHQKKSALFSHHIHKIQPVLVSMSEAYIYNDVPKGYALHFENVKDCDNSVRLLIRKDWEVLSLHATPMEMTWHYRDKLKQPRNYQRGLLKGPTGEFLRFMGVHFETYGPNGPNHEQWHDSAQRVNQFFEFSGRGRKDFDIPSLTLGDWNALGNEVRNAIEYPVVPAAKVDHFAHNHKITPVGNPKRLLMTPGVHGWYALKIKIGN